MEKRRVGIIDEIRGFAILCMVVYHLMFDLNYNYGVSIPIFFDDWFAIIRDIFAGAFIFISGTACQYSRNNLKRGVECFFIGMVLTFITAFIAPYAPITFGILHCLGVCMMIYGLFEKLLEKVPTLLGLIVTIVIFVLTFDVQRGHIGLGNIACLNLPDMLYDAELLFPLGFPPASFAALDYFPLFPWLFLFLGGAFTGVYFKENRMPAFMYRTHIPFFAWVGKYTIWIYLAHQPLIYVVLALIFGKAIF